MSAVRVDYRSEMSSRLSVRVAKCSTWNQLFRAALRADEANEPFEKGVYYSGYRFCSAELLNQTLKAVKDGHADLNSITRNHGLRDKAAKLLNSLK